MILGNAPEFDWVMRRIRIAEDAINRGKWERWADDNSMVAPFRYP